MTRLAKKKSLVENFLHPSLLEMDYTEAKYILLSILRRLHIL